MINKLICRSKMIFMLLSKRKTTEILFGIELIVLVFLLMLALIPISNALNLVNGIDDVTSNASMVYCVPTASNSNPIPVNEMRSVIENKFGKIPHVYFTKSSVYSTETGSKGYFILVSKDWYSNIELDLDSGELTDTYGEYVPVVISSSLSERFNIGDLIECNVSNKIVTCYITGVLKYDSVLLDIKKQNGSVITADAIGFNMSKYSTDFIVAVTNDSISIPDSSIDSALFAFPNGTKMDAIVNELNNCYSNAYNFSSYSLIRKNTIEDSITDMDWRIVFTFLFLVVVFVNFVCYIVAISMQNQKTLSIMTICGLSFVDSVIINFFSLLTTIFPAVIIGEVISPFILRNIGIEFYGYNRLVIIIVLLAFMIMTLTAAVMSVWQKKKVEVISLYKRG